MRTKWMDPDFRRRPTTREFCCICQNDLGSKERRQVRYEPEKYEAIHPADWANAPADAVSGMIGPDCAKRLGLEWSIRLT